MFVRFVFTSVLAAFALTAVADDAVDFQRQIQPIFVEHCAKCHGEAKAQAKLRLDIAAGIEEKLAAKPTLIVAGKPDESELYKRLVLPADSPKRMPKGADPLSQADIDLVAAWIKQGAMLTVATAAVAAPTTAPVAETKPEPKPEPKQSDKPALPEVAAASQAAIDRLAAAGARVNPLYSGSNLIEVSFAGRAEPAGDADVALLGDVADQLYSLNLADAKASSTGLAPLGKLKHLAWIHLERSSVTDDAIANLANLTQLQYLNLYGTPITDAGLKQLAGLKSLTRLYLWQTKVSYDTAMGLERDIPGLIVNLGFDHPEVMKRRLASELELAKKQVESSNAELTKAKDRLASASKEAESSAARVTDIEQQLKKLESPSAGTVPAADSGQ